MEISRKGLGDYGRDLHVTGSMHAFNGRMGSLLNRRRGMGSWLSDLTGVNIQLPTSDLTQSAQAAIGAATQKTVQQVIAQPAVQQTVATAAQQQAASGIGNWILKHPYESAGILVGFGILGFIIAKR